MSERKDIARKSVAIMLLDQMVTYFLNFISRKVFLMTIGVGYLGLNSTLAQILGTLSVSELGIQAVIIYRLYKPMVEGDHRLVCQIMSVIKQLYRYVAVFIFSGSLILIPFLSYFIHDVDIAWEIIYTAWIMMALTTALSYTMNYNSTVIFADQKQYIYQRIHLVLNAAIVIINMILLYFWQNYLLYLGIGLLNTLLGNVVLLYLRRKFYPWIVSVDAPKDLMKDVTKSSIDVFAGRISGYVLNSTSYMVISALISTTAVGYVSNYTTISMAVGFIISNICGPIQALVGNMLVNKQEKELIGFTKRLSYAIYAMGAVLILLMALLVDDFVSLFYGPEYVLDRGVLCLLVAELYIAHNQSAAGLMLEAAGEFKIERQFYINSAVLTVVLSVIGALTIGVLGVLGGIVCGRLYLWWCRGYYCHKHVIKNLREGISIYLRYQFRWLLVFIVSWQILNLFLGMLFKEASIQILFMKGGIVLLFTIASHFLIFGRTPEFKYLADFLWKSKVNH